MPHAKPAVVAHRREPVLCLAFSSFFFRRAPTRPRVNCDGSHPAGVAPTHGHQTVVRHRIDVYQIILAARRDQAFVPGPGQARDAAIPRLRRWYHGGGLDQKDKGSECDFEW